MNPLYSVALPLLMVALPTVPLDERLTPAAFPTIPTLWPAGPPTTGIVAHDDGTVFFVDSFHSIVWRLSPGRSPVPHVTGRNGRSLQMSADGSLFGTHRAPGGRAITWRAAADGRVEHVHEATVPLHGASLHYQAVTASSLAADGSLLATVGSGIHRIARDGSARIVVAETPLLRGRGPLLSRLLGESQDHLTGITEDAAGNIYVTNIARAAVVVIRPDGSVSDVVAAGDGWTPTGVAASAHGVFVLEYGHGVRVRHVTHDGTHSLVATVRPERSTSTAMALPALPGRS